MDLTVNNGSHSIALKDMAEEERAENVGTHQKEQENCYDDLEEIDLSSPKRNGGGKDKRAPEAESRNQQSNGEVSDEAMTRMEEGRPQELVQWDWKPITHALVFFLGYLLAPLTAILIISLYIFPCTPQKWRQNSHIFRASVGAALGFISIGVAVVILHGIKTFKSR